MSGRDDDLEDEGGQGAESAVCADAEPLGVVSGDVLHGLRAERAGVWPSMTVTSDEQGVPDVGPLGSGGGGHEFSDDALPPMVGTAAQVTRCSSRYRPDRQSEHR